MSKAKALCLGLVMVFCLVSLLFAGSDTVTISAVVDNGDDTYTLTVDDTTGMTVGDHFGARLSTGAGALYSIGTIDAATTVTIADTLDEEKGSDFGAPAVGSGWFATPTSTSDLSKPPFRGPGWDAAMRRNAHLLDAAGAYDASAVAITGGTITGITDLAVADGGTGSSTAANARTALGAQASDADLTALAAIAGVQGDVIYHNGTAWVRLAAGTDGQVLTTGGSGANPAWEDSVTVNSPVVLHSSYDAIASGSLTYTTPASTLGTNGDMLRVRARGSVTYAESGEVTITFGAIEVGASETLSASVFFDIEVLIVRGSSSTDLDSISTSVSWASSGGAQTPSTFRALGFGAQSFAVEQDLTVDVSGATNVISVQQLTVELLPAP